MTDPNGEPKDDKPPRDRPDPRPPSPNALRNPFCTAAEARRRAENTRLRGLLLESGVTLLLAQMGHRPHEDDDLFDLIERALA